MGITKGYQKEVLEHLDIRGVNYGRINPHLGNLALTVCVHGDHAAARASAHAQVGQLGLDLLEAALHLLSLFQNL